MNKKLSKLIIAAAIMAAFFGAFLSIFGQAGPTPAILGLKERAEVFDSWLKIRLERVLPEIMRRENIDMWVVICREYNEDPVYLTLVPYSSMSARRLSILVFFDKGKDGLERLSVSRYGIGEYYKAMYEPGKADQWERLAQIIKERSPKKIGIDESETFAFGDGLSASHKASLVKALGPELSKRLVSAERLAVGWLERRTPEELEVYTHIVGIAHRIVADAFSRNVITPGVTTTDDVVWWMRERVAELKLGTWFQPSISIQRPKSSGQKDGRVIHQGDLLHSDFGITYLGLNTDNQEHAYVLREGEEDAPQGLKAALAQGNRLQDILISEFKAERPGNEILAAALEKAKKEGLKPSIYTHPLGFHGHAAGPTIGLWDMQAGVPGLGDYQLYFDTVHSIELNIRATVPEWGNQEVQIALEQDAVFSRAGTYFIDGRQTKLHLIK